MMQWEPSLLHPNANLTGVCPPIPYMYACKGELYPVRNRGKHSVPPSRTLAGRPV